MTLSIPFSGWYQMRLATDGDRYDDPRGGSQGWVFAVEGEPDLDRIIRFQPAGTFMRKHISPEVKVGVLSVTPVTTDPELDVTGLERAPVELLANAVFEGRNGQIAPSAREPIWPLHPSVTGTDWKLDRPFSDEMDQDQPARTSFVAGPEGLQVAKELLEGFGMPAGTEATTTFVAAANEKLTLAAQESTDPVKKANLQKRIGRVIVITRMAMQWRAELSGTATIEAPGEHASRLEATAPWRVEMLSTGFSSDSMCALITGWLHVPSAGESLGDGDWKLPGPATP